MYEEGTQRPARLALDIVSLSVFSWQVIDQANEILSCISQPSVCSEVLLSPAGTAYIWGMAGRRCLKIRGSSVGLVR